MDTPTTNPLHIAIVRQRYTPHGGAERFVQNMLETLQQHTHIEITIITRRWKTKEENKFKVIECDPFYIGRLWRDWSFYKGACNTLKKYDFDIIQSHERITCADIYRAGEGVHLEWLRQRKRIRPWWKNIWISMSPYHQFVLRQERLVFENQKLITIISNSQTTKREIEQNFSHIKANIIVITNAVNQLRFHPQLSKQYRSYTRANLKIHETNIVSLFIGSGNERKGVNQLLEIFSHLPDAHHLVIVGKDKNIVKFKSIAKEKKLVGRVHFMGPQQDVRPYLGIADLFVFPSLYDPLPNSVLEAAAAGIPVLASKTTGAADLTSAMGLPQLDPLDTYSWINTIKKFNQHKKQITIDMSCYSREAMKHNLVQLYKYVLEKKQ